MPKEVRIELTAAQKAKIKAATGKTMSEIRVSSIGKNLAVSGKSFSDKSMSDKSLSDKSLSDKSLSDKSFRMS